MSKSGVEGKKNIKSIVEEGDLETIFCELVLLSLRVWLGLLGCLPQDGF